MFKAPERDTMGGPQMLTTPIQYYKGLILVTSTYRRTLSINNLDFNVFVRYEAMMTLKVRS